MLREHVEPVVVIGLRHDAPGKLNARAERCADGESAPRV